MTNNSRIIILTKDKASQLLKQEDGHTPHSSSSDEVRVSFEATRCVRPAGEVASRPLLFDAFRYVLLLFVPPAADTPVMASGERPTTASFFTQESAEGQDDDFRQYSKVGKIAAGF